MKSLFMVPVVLVLLSCVPPVRSGPNCIYLRRVFSTCWRTKRVFRKSCGKKEEYNIFCSSVYLCCTDKKNLPVEIGK
ncbi:LOW QUALITY PROTEIN: beta-defensin 135 [Neovison vison]|uniref:LOW QUALITY PROTEIN: beta-defensin 135 n=1 Tax=Neovison vison TaxID=452646 RepID=UPI001CEFE340|nr:LOW QUALITY PROTEIN: beta-defensin 135 [Neogale vison]